MKFLPNDISLLLSEYVYIYPYLNKYFNVKNIIYNGIIVKCLTNMNLIYSKVIKKLVKNDEEFMKIALKREGFLLGLASKKIRRNLNIVLIAVNNRGRSLWFADKSLKYNKELVCKAVKNDISSLTHASKKLKSDINFIKYLISGKTKAQINEIVFYCRPIKYNDNTEKNINHLLDMGVKLNNLRSVCPEEINVFENYKMAKKAVINEGYQAFRYISQRLKNDHIDLLYECRKYQFSFRPLGTDRGLHEPNGRFLY